MIHNFDSEIAQKYGILEAVILNHIYFWIEKNRANEQNFFDGYYWTFNSTKAFSELFPYASERQINYALKHLRDDGILLVGNYNENAYDRTLWYAISEKGFAVLEKREIKVEDLKNASDKNEESILQNCQMENTDLSNGFDSNVEPIPDNKPDIKPDNKPNIEVSNDTSCSEPEQCSAHSLNDDDQQLDFVNNNGSGGNGEHPVIQMMLNDKTLYDVYQKDVDYWKELYPMVDVMQSLRSMKGWIDSNPTKRKTKRGIRRFINSWLEREQNRGGCRNGIHTGIQTPKSRWEDML